MRQIVLAITGLIIATAVGCCPLESKFYFPQQRDFDTPADVEDVYFQTADGYELHAWFVPAPSLRSGVADAAPAVIFCPGSRTQIDALAPQLRPIGEAADVSLLLVSYRGYGRSDDARCVTRKATLKDAEAALEALLVREDVSTDAIGVMGYSLGGVAALALAAERDEIEAAVIGGTYSTANAALDDIDRGGWYWLVGDDLDPVDSARAVDDCPVLVFHGERDNDARPYHAEAIAAALDGSGTRYELYMVPNADHFNVLIVDETLTQRIADFLRQNLQE